MKVALIALRHEHLSHMAAAAMAADGAAELVELTGSLQHHVNLLREAKPDIVVLEASGAGQELSAIEALTAQGEVEVVLLSPDRSPEFLLRAMQAGVREVLPIPLADRALEDALMRLARRAKQGASTPHAAQVLAFVTCKGGGGTTLIATNLAYALAAAGKRVIFMDLNAPYGEAEIYVTNQQPSHTLADVTEKIERLDEALLGSALLRVNDRFGLLPAAHEVDRGLAIMPDQVCAVIDVATKMADFVVLDVPGSFSGLSIAALDRADIVFPVIEATLPFIRNAKRTLDLFSQLGYGAEKVRVLLNRLDKGGEITAADVEKVLAVKVYWTLPNSYRVAATSMNHGVPVIDIAPRDPLARALIELAGKLTYVGAKSDSKGIARRLGILGRFTGGGTLMRTLRPTPTVRSATPTT